MNLNYILNDKLHSCNHNLPIRCAIDRNSLLRFSSYHCDSQKLEKLIIVMKKLSARSYIIQLLQSINLFFFSVELCAAQRNEKKCDAIPAECHVIFIKIFFYHWYERPIKSTHRSLIFIFIEPSYLARYQCFPGTNCLAFKLFVFFNEINPLNYLYLHMFGY